tara:strand:- start:190 stop:351 length:162 start_codon:yes stop_codon:yes gene_type:complete
VEHHSGQEDEDAEDGNESYEAFIHGLALPPLFVILGDQAGRADDREKAEQAYE